MKNPDDEIYIGNWTVGGIKRAKEEGQRRKEAREKERRKSDTAKFIMIIVTVLMLQLHISVNLERRAEISASEEVEQ